MGVLRSLLKLLVLALLGAVAVAVAVATRSTATPVTIDSWPDVPANPAA